MTEQERIEHWAQARKEIAIVAGYTLIGIAILVVLTYYMLGGGAT